MRCPKCEQWNRSSLPRCSKCGEPLNAAAPVEPSWRAKVQSSSAKAYIRVDEDGQADVTPDRRDVLAQHMSEFKVRVDEGMRRKQLLMTNSLPVITPEESAVPPESADPFADAADPFADAADPFSDTAPLDDPFAESGDPFAFDAGQEAPAAPEAPAAEASPSQTTRRNARVAIHGLPGTQSIPVVPGQPAIRRGTMTPGQWQDNRSYDPEVESMQQQNMFRDAPAIPQQKQPKMRSRHRSKRMFVNWVTAILVCVVAALASVVGVSAYNRYREARAAENQAYVTASMKDDQAAHTILIPGEDGQKIHIRELHRTFEVVGGFATIVIPDHEWYEEMEVVTEETMTVTLSPSYQTSGGRQRALEQITYTIDIPLSPIECISPSKPRLEVTTPMYSMEFLVRPNSTVLINGVDMSDGVDDNGRLVYNAAVQPKGDNVYTINVRSPYCRDNSMEVVLFRQVQEIPLDLAVTTYSTTNESKYQISCTTLPGAQVDVLSPHSDLVITDLATTGEFSFYALFDKIGTNKVIIQATYPGKKTSLVEYEIYYLPSADIYTRKAWALSNPADYAELTGNITLRASKSSIYVAMGTIDHFITDSPQMAVMYCSEDGKSHPVILQNETKTVWKKGQYYRIYADVYGSYDGMPWLVARYTYID